MDLIRKLDPSSTEAQTLYRQQRMDSAALDRLRGLKNGVVAFTSFTSFTDNEERIRDFPGNVVWKLHSSHRMKIGNLSEFPDGDECLLPPGSAVQIMSVTNEGERGIVDARDLPLLKATDDGRERLRSGHELWEVPLASDLKMDGGDVFGFVTSVMGMDLLGLSRFAEADERDSSRHRSAERPRGGSADTGVARCRRAGSDERRDDSNLRSGTERALGGREAAGVSRY
jgi:hypothetical protein